MDSRAAAKNKSKLQFSYYDPMLPNRLANDIQRSSFPTRPKYLNALLEKVLSLPMRTATSSHIDEFFAWMELFDMLPTERIRQLAPTQNRNFDQMVKHLLEIALSYYPETSQMSVVAREGTSPQSEAYPPGLADYARWSDTNYRPSAVPRRAS